jgi:hypothetical protein
LPTNELVGLRQMFEAIDEDGSGTISVDELREGLRKKGTLLALQVNCCCCMIAAVTVMACSSSSCCC